MLTRIIVGLLVTGLGILCAYKTNWILSAVGQVDWAERTWGPGGSRLFWKLFGVAIIMIGFSILTNLFDGFMTGLVGGLFGR
jgi:hypothetical protein